MPRYISNNFTNVKACMLTCVLVGGPCSLTLMRDLLLSAVALQATYSKQRHTTHTGPKSSSAGRPTGHTFGISHNHVTPFSIASRTFSFRKGETAD